MLSQFLSRVLVVVVALVVGLPEDLQAGLPSTTVRETTELVVRKFGKEAAKEGTEALASRLERLVARHGTEALTVARKAGPAGIKALEEAGEHSKDVVKLLVRHGDEAIWITAKPGRLAMFVRYGDDAAEAMVRHRQLAASLIEQFGSPCAKAVKGLGGQNARRLAMMAENGELALIKRTPELFETIGKYGDRAMEFVWKHKGALAVSTTLAAFLHDPEPFLNGIRDITVEVAPPVLKPLGEVPGKVAETAAKNVNWTVVWLTACGLVIFFGLGGISGIWRRLQRRCPAVSRGEAPVKSLRETSR